MENLILVSTFCTQHHIELAFIHSLQEYGLIETTAIEQNLYFQEDQLKEVERLMHLHYDLQINLEGVDVVIQLLKRMEDMQHEITGLQNRLRLYESGPLSPEGGT